MTTTRREFVKTLLAGTAGLSLLPPAARAANKEAFAFVLQGDLHFEQFQYADLPGYAVVRVSGPKVSATIYSGMTRRPWRTPALSELLAR